jgi:uncharacterized membrane protein
VITAISGYELAKFLHVATVVVAFGAPFAYPFFVGLAERSAPQSVPGVLRAIVTSDRFLVTPGLLIVLVAGIWAMGELDVDASESWITVGFLAILALGGLIHGLYDPAARRAIAIAERDLAEGPELSPEYRALSARMNVIGGLEGAVVIVAVFFMVVKP